MVKKTLRKSAILDVLIKHLLLLHERISHLDIRTIVRAMNRPISLSWSHLYSASRCLENHCQRWTNLSKKRSLRVFWTSTHSTMQIFREYIENVSSVSSEHLRDSSGVNYNIC